MQLNNGAFINMRCVESRIKHVSSVRDDKRHYMKITIIIWQLYTHTDLHTHSNSLRLLSNPPNTNYWLNVVLLWRPRGCWAKHQPLWPCGAGCVCVCVMRPRADRSSQHENRTCDQIRPELSELSVWVTAVNLRVTFNFIMAHVYHWSPFRETLYTGKASAVRENVFNT